MRAWRAARWSTVYLEASRIRPFTTSRAWTGSSVNDLLKQNENAQAVTVTGWVRSVRKQKRVAFAAVSDGSTINALQAVLKPDDASKLSYGTAVKLKGDWKASAGPKQSHELQVSSVEVLGDNDAENNPIQPKHQTAEFLRTIPHLRARTPSNALLLRLRSQLIASLTNFFNNADFVQTHTPIITSSDCEGAGEVFTISATPSDNSNQHRTSHPSAQSEHFFRTPKYLTVSAQLHLEALSQAVNKVWTLSPTFRAERSDTPRHLSEFYMLEAEMCFVQDLDEVMDLVENMLRSVVSPLRDGQIFSELLKSGQNADKDGTQSEVENFVSAQNVEKRWAGLVAPNWPRITYASAIDILNDAQTSKEASFTFAPTYRDGLQAEHERYLASTIGEGKPVFVTDYPCTQKPFYMPPSTTTANSKGSPDTAACFDLLVPDLCELAGGSIREHRSAELLEAMQSKGLAGSNLDWYQDLRKYGSVPHGGFGLGFDRLLCYLSGVGSVRDVVAFPRWYGRCDC